MNNIVTILNAAKEAFIASDHERVQALLLPLSSNANIEIAGTACYICGLSMMAQRKSGRAIELFQMAVDIKHKDPALYEGLGATLQQNAEYDRAEEIYRTGLDVCGPVPTLLSHLATIELLRGNTSSAEELLKKSLRIDDKDHMGWTNLGNLFQVKGYYRDAVNCYKEALKILPSYDGAISNLLLTSNYTRLSHEEIFEAHKTYCSKIVPTQLPPLPRRKPGKRIRIGYLSGDFKTHSVSYFFASLLENHNRNEFEVYCFSDVYRPDPVTLRFESSSDKWRDISRMTNEEVGALIRNDSIDILIDLTGHAGSKRLSLFRGRPSPAAVTYLGYPNTLGIPEVQYRIVDPITDPEDENDQYYTEELKRVASPFICYMPPADMPSVENTPAIKNGYITFGSCNNLAKLSDETVEIWGSLLREIPDSHLYLKSKPLKDPNTAEEIFMRLEAVGIERVRVTVEGHRNSNNSHLCAYNEVDIALDNFPYNGTTTTCEALIMGVPVLTIRGDRHSARVSASILSSINHKELIAENRDEFTRIGVELAKDLPRLTQIRRSLRQDVRTSPLCDGKRLANNIEKIYIDIFCATAPESDL